MGAAAVVALVAQVLPMLLQDLPAAVNLLHAASSAIGNAAANGGQISPDDWAALDTQRAAAEAAFRAACG